MSTAAGREGADLLGLAPGTVVQELGWDVDADADLRERIMDIIDADMVEEAVEAVDVVLLWWRDEDGDVVDGLMDAMTDLAEGGYIWLLTPRLGQPQFVEPGDLAEGVATAGLALTRTATVAANWQAHKVVRPKAGRKS